jgi:hypothetical protein
MYALIGRVRIKPGHEDETRAMIEQYGVGMVQGMAGSRGGWWARPVETGNEVVQHSFWLFESEEQARAAEATFLSLKSMPDAPAEFLSAEVCEVIGHT